MHGGSSGLPDYYLCLCAASSTGKTWEFPLHNENSALVSGTTTTANVRGSLH